MTNKGYHWYNNGMIQKMFKEGEQPADYQKGVLPRTAEWKINHSKMMKGNIPWNKGKKGVQKAWNKGLNKESHPSLARSEETKQKLSKHWKGKPKNDEWKKHQSEAQKGKKLSQGTKNKISQKLSGRKVEHLEERNKKEFQTKLKNKSFNSSKPEILYKAILLDRNLNIKIQYFDNRYPFHVDFYLPEKDLFIELNLNPSHGKHPFNSKDVDDMNLVKKWQANQKYYTDKNGKLKKNFYYVFEEVFTKRDPLKLKTALINKLNYAIIYPKSCYIFEQGELKLKIESTDLLYNENNIKNILNKCLKYYMDSDGNVSTVLIPGGDN